MRQVGEGDPLEFVVVLARLAVRFGRGLAEFGLARERGSQEVQHALRTVGRVLDFVEDDLAKLDVNGGFFFEFADGGLPGRLPCFNFAARDHEVLPAVAVTVDEEDLALIDDDNRTAPFVVFVDVQG